MPIEGFTQASVSFNIDGKNYPANLSWVIKHNGTNSRQQTAHTLNKALDGNFDLAIFFKFPNDSVFTDPNLVWGFGFDQGGGIITPARNEKRSRSLHLFQRFKLTGSGNANLTISPKIWRRNSAGQFQLASQAAPITLGFTVTDVAEQEQIAPVATTSTDSFSSTNTIPTDIPSSVEDTEEAKAFTEAVNTADSTQKIKALIDFVDEYVDKKPESELVERAIKNVPLGTSLPERKGAGNYTFNLDYAVKPVVDSSSVQGWRWELLQYEYGRYQLNLADLGDSVHSIRVADLGKNAPFNQPKELSPFEKIEVRLIGEDRDSFRIQTSGGLPPFIVFLSQKKIPKARYVLSSTDTIWSISKASCKLCKTGEHTLEVYSSDFSTLLLRADSAIHIFKISRYTVGMLAVIALLVVAFSFKPLLRKWKQFKYERTLRDIEAWEDEN